MASSFVVSLKVVIVSDCGYFDNHLRRFTTSRDYHLGDLGWKDPGPLHLPSESFQISHSLIFLPNQFLISRPRKGTTHPHRVNQWECQSCSTRQNQKAALEQRIREPELLLNSPIIENHAINCRGCDERLWVGRPAMVRWWILLCLHWGQKSYGRSSLIQEACGSKLQLSSLSTIHPLDLHALGIQPNDPSLGLPALYETANGTCCIWHGAAYSGVHWHPAEGGHAL